MSNTLVVLNNNREVASLAYNNEVVITTKMLAEVYECEGKQIKQNFNNNKDKFIEGKHYYKLEGEELRKFKHYCKVENIDLVKANVNNLYLWTKRGASRHCKMLGTDKAWDMFDVLEENYFNPKRQPQQVVSVEQVTQIATVAAQAAAQAVIAPIMDRLEKLIAPKEAPKTKENKIKTPYSVSKIAKLANMKRNDVNPILRDQKIISGNTRTGWVLNKEYEEAGWGITNENGGQYNGSFVMYSKKGKDAILKILNRVNEQEQLNLF